MREPLKKGDKIFRADTHCGELSMTVREVRSVGEVWITLTNGERISTRVANAQSPRSEDEAWSGLERHLTSLVERNATERTNLLAYLAAARKRVVGPVAN